MFMIIPKKILSRMKFVTGLDTVKPVVETVRTDFCRYGRFHRKKR